MNDGEKLAQKVLNKLVNHVTNRVFLGKGSSISLDFGRDILSEYKVRGKVFTRTVGEFCLFICSAAWRLDQKDKHIVSSNDPHDRLEEKLTILEKKKLLDISVVNRSFDLNIKFEQDFKVSLFSFCTVNRFNETWMFFLPNKKVFTAGPGNNWTYKHPSRD